MTFYSDLRDGSVASLLDRFGMSAVHRKIARTYNTATGQVSATNSDTTVRLVKLPTRPAGGELSPDFPEEIISKIEYVAVVGAKELVGKSVDNGDVVIISSRNYTVIGVKSIEPAGVPVVYKLALAGAG